MKTNFLKMMILPVAAFMLASAGAVSTNASKASISENPPMLAYAHTTIPGVCEPQDVNCSTTFSTTICKSSEATPRQVWLKNNQGVCNINLYKP